VGLDVGTATQDVEPRRPFVQVVCLHGLQLELPILSAYLPDSQRTHLWALPRAYLPTGQDVHLVAPFKTVYLPEVQSLQLFQLELSEYWP
jgi:hypothetical protein